MSILEIGSSTTQRTLFSFKIDAINEIIVSFIRGQASGHMNVKFSNGDIYDGHMLIGQYDGKGKLVYHDEKGYYDGFWTLGKFNGKGVRIYSDGSKFVGDFLAGSQQALLFPFIVTIACIYC